MIAIAVTHHQSEPVSQRRAPLSLVSQRNFPFYFHLGVVDGRLSVPPTVAAASVDRPSTIGSVTYACEGLYAAKEEGLAHARARNQ